MNTQNMIEDVMERNYYKSKQTEFDGEPSPFLTIFSTVITLTFDLTTSFHLK